MNTSAGLLLQASITRLTGDELFLDETKLLKLSELNSKVRTLTLLYEAVSCHVHLLDHHLFSFRNERWNWRVLFAHCSGDEDLWLTYDPGRYIRRVALE